MTQKVSNKKPAKKARSNKKVSDRLTLRERRLIKALAEGAETTAEAMRIAGYSESFINSRPERITGKPHMREAISELMDRMGITDERLMATLNAGLEATKVVKDFDDVHDYAVRHKYLDTALKLKEKYPSEKHDVNHSGAVFIIEGLNDG